MDTTKVDSEDEDIVIQGSALHEHLFKLGYKDFESTCVNRTVKEEEGAFKFSNFVNSIKSIVKKVLKVYSWIIQENEISKKQLATILDTKPLLDDHACMIHKFFKKYNSECWSIAPQECIFFGAIITSPMCLISDSGYKISAGLFATCTLVFLSYIKYSRFYAHRNLKAVVSLQNDLFKLCKRGLEILRYEYSIPLSSGKCRQFYDLTENRLQCLQPIMENLVTCMEQVSQIYYQVSLILVKLLSKDLVDDDLLTKFEKESLNVHGEINYEVLKNLYHTYILTQSEMLHLLALAYSSCTWQQCSKRIPELKLAHIIYSLMGYLSFYKHKLSKVIDDYYNIKAETVKYKYKESVRLKWKDLYVHLFLTSNKLQVAYSHISSILSGIDNSTNETQIDDELVEIVMEKLNEAYKEIDIARSFAEFSSLLTAKMRVNRNVNNDLKENIAIPIVNDHVPIVNDQEPIIEDEVFEEYIKEEYIKPLYEKGNEILIQNYKWEKFLAKNFMAELKEALIDKQKSMSERESKALQRMYSGVNILVKETNERVNTQNIPVPPPMPPLDRLNSNETPPPKPKPRFELKEKSRKESLSDSFDEERYSVPLMQLPKIQFETQSTGFPTLPLPPSFLRSSEETFVGSGENSEDDFDEEFTDDTKKEV